MKKIFFAIVIIMTISLSANAQRGNDAFVTNWDSNSNRIDAIALTLPGSLIGDDSNDPAPLGSGLLVLTALGAGYAVAQRRRK